MRKDVSWFELSGEWQDPCTEQQLEYSFEAVALYSAQGVALLAGGKYLVSLCDGHCQVLHVETLLAVGAPVAAARHATLLAQAQARPPRLPGVPVPYEWDEDEI